MNEGTRFMHAGIRLATNNEWILSGEFTINDSRPNDSRFHDLRFTIYYSLIHAFQT